MEMQYFYEPLDGALIDAPLMVSYWYFFSALLAFLVSLGLSISLVKSVHWHIARTARGHNRGEPQGIHSNPTPRVGGVALFGGLLGASLTAPDSSGYTLTLLIVASLPVFFVGLLEDLSIRMSPKRRLLAAIASAAIAVGLTGAHIQATGISLLDASLEYQTFAVAVSVFAVAGMSHGFNLIDGLNGLAGGVTITMAGGIALIAFAVGSNEIAFTSLMVIAATFGFLFLNFPGGHLFLGDAGAYTVGFLLSFLAIMLVAANPQVSIFSLVLCGFWPFIDTMAAIARRLFMGRPVGAPDRLHFHHLMLRLVKPVFGKGRSGVFVNSLSSLILLPLYSLPILLAVASYDNLKQSALYLVLMTILYFINRFLICRAIRIAKTIRPHHDIEFVSD